MKILNSISKKVMLGYVSIVSVLLITAFFLYQESSLISKHKETFTQETLPLLRSVEDASRALNTLQLASFGLYGFTLEKNDFDLKVNQGKGVLNEHLTLIQTSGLSQESDLLTKSKDFLKEVQVLRDIMAAKKTNWDAARTALNDIQSHAEGLQGMLTEAKTQASENAQMASTYITKEISIMRMLILVSVALILLITFVSYLSTQGGIAAPVKLLSRQLDDIAVNRDLSKDVSAGSGDEIGDAAKSVNELLVAFRNSNREIQSSATVLVQSVSKLNHSAQLSEEQVSKFSQNIQSILDKVNALEHNIEDSASRSGSASEMALQGAQQVREGAMNVSNTARSIESLSEDVSQSTEMLLSLKNAGDQVGSVVKTIAEIAEQTNLLALNAAIEAARAGESGRGFAVVADEVRTLASRTHDSTHEINNILDSIVASISSTVTSMEANKTKASEVVLLAQNTVESLDTIQATIVKLSEESKQVASLSQDNQSHASTMRMSIDQIQRASEQVTESSLETRTASESLTQISTALDNVAQQFKL